MGNVARTLSVPEYHRECGSATGGAPRGDESAEEGTKESEHEPKDKEYVRNLLLALAPLAPIKKRIT